MILFTAAEALVDYLYWDLFPVWGIIGLALTASTNRQLNWLAKEWLNDFHGKSDHDWEHEEEEHHEEMYENEDED